MFGEGLLDIAALLGGGVQPADEAGVLGLGLGEEPAGHAVGVARLHLGEVKADAESPLFQELEADVVRDTFGEPAGDLAVGLQDVDELAGSLGQRQPSVGVEKMNRGSRAALARAGRKALGNA